MSNHFLDTVQSRNPLTMHGFSDPPYRPLTPPVRPRSAQGTSNLLTWSKPSSKTTAAQECRTNRDRITKSSHNLLSHQEFKSSGSGDTSETKQKPMPRADSEKSIIAFQPTFTHLTGARRGKAKVGVESGTRSVTQWGTDDVKYVQKYDKLQDGSVSAKNREERSRRNILHLTEREAERNRKPNKSANDLYWKNMTTTNLLSTEPKGKSRTMGNLSKIQGDFEKLSVRRDNEIQQRAMCRNDTSKPKWR